MTEERRHAQARRLAIWGIVATLFAAYTQPIVAPMVFDWWRQVHSSTHQTWRGGNPKSSEDGVYISPDGGQFTVSGWKVTFSFGGDQVEFFNVGHQPLTAELSQGINVETPEMDRHPALQAELKKYRTAMPGGSYFTIVLSVYGGVIFLDGHTFRKAGTVLAKTYYNRVYGRITIDNADDGFAWEVNGHAFKGSFTRDNPGEAHIDDDGSPSLAYYAAAVGAPDPNIDFNKKYFRVDDNSIVTPGGVVFARNP